MTSTLSVKAELNARSKFFLAIPGVLNVYAFDPTDIPDQGVQTFASTAAISSFFSGVTRESLTSGDLYRDLGRAVYIKLADGSNVAILRLVQQVKGDISSGVPASMSAGYILTWIADPALDTVNIGTVGVARTG